MYYRSCRLAEFTRVGVLYGRKKKKGTVRLYSLKYNRNQMESLYRKIYHPKNQQVASERYLFSILSVSWKVQQNPTFMV